jgi:methylmalonyl-CoA mutase N-terminal domain/subunit
MGGAVAAIEEGWMQAQIEDAAYIEARRQADGSGVVVGVNRYGTGGGAPVPMLEVDPSLEEEQRQRLAAWRASRNEATVEAALDDLQGRAGGDGNLLPPMKDALRHGATVGEVSNRLRAVFGVYRPV